MADEWDEISERELERTPEPPKDLTHEEQVGWRHGYIHGYRRAVEDYPAPS